MIRYIMNESARTKLFITNNNEGKRSKYLSQNNILVVYSGVFFHNAITFS